MKIKSKRPFGEKYQLRREQADEKARLKAEWQRKQRFDKFEKMYQKFLDGEVWYQRSQGLLANDPCEFFDQSTWHAATFVEHLVRSAGQPMRGRVLDAQGNCLCALYVRQPGDQEAWPEARMPKSEELLKMEEKLAKQGLSPFVKYAVKESA